MVANCPRNETASRMATAIMNTLTEPMTAAQVCYLSGADKEVAGLPSWVQAQRMQGVISALVDQGIIERIGWRAGYEVYAGT